MEKIILTTTEADALNAFYSEGANIYELASAARLSPSHLKEVLSNLAGKGLVEIRPDGHAAVMLTPKGRHARMLLDKYAKTPYQSKANAFRELTVVDDDGPEKYVELDEEAIDARLEEAINNLV